MQHLAAGFAGFVGYVLAVAIGLRITARTSPAVVVLALAFSVYLMLLAVELYFRAPVRFWAVSAGYWFFVACFLMVFGAVYKSISLRILGNLSERPGRSDHGDAVARYVKQQSFEDRLQVMVDAGFARRSGAGYEVTSRGRRIAVVISGLHRAFAIGKSG